MILGTEVMERTYVLTAIIIFIAATLLIGMLVILVCCCLVGVFVFAQAKKRRSYSVYTGEDNPLLESLIGESNPLKKNNNSNTATGSEYDAPENSLREYRPSETEDKKRKKHEEATNLNLQFYMRGHGAQIRLIRLIKCCGHRVDKTNFLIEGQRGLEILSMTPSSQHCVVEFDSDAVKATVWNVLQGCSHPHILPTVTLDYLVDRELLLIRRPYAKVGSLKDVIYGSKPGSPYVEKYRKQGQRFPVAQMARWGREILEGLRYLRAKGLVFGHLHAGNVIVCGESRMCKITDYENAFLNLAPQLQAFHLQIPDRDPDIIGFGHILFELGCGTSMDRPDTLKIPSHCPKVIRDILVAIFSDGEFDPLRTVEDVLRVPFFADVDLQVPTSRPRIDIRAAELLKKVALSTVVGRADAICEPRFVNLEDKVKRSKKKVREVVPTAFNRERVQQIDRDIEKERKRMEKHPNNTSSSDWDEPL